MNKIIFITGGAYQGKLEYAKEKYKIDDKDIAEPDENGYINDEELKKKCINNFNLIIKHASDKSEDITEICDDILKKHEGSDVVIIMNDVGSGIVPMEKSERVYRENVGRAGCYIAKRADVVVRVSCGCGMAIKQSGMKLVFIRHGMTKGNLEKRYIGRTDEDLCEEGIHELEKRTYPDVKRVISSPMKRCIQTAEIIYPDISIEIEDELKECDFGKFEGKNYYDLNGDTDYQNWIDSGGTLDFPEGESLQEFKDRCIHGFEKIIESVNEDTAFVVHGGTIMAIMEKYDAGQKGYFDYQLGNGEGYVCEFREGKLYTL